MLGQAIDRDFMGRATLDVYTQTILSDEMQAGFDSIGSINLKGAVSGDEVRTIQKEADMLLHIEGFSEKSLFEVRMSFSTKLIDYMLTGVPILAIGPKEANSMLVLESNRLATVITDPENMSDRLRRLFESGEICNENRENVVAYLTENRLIGTIQAGIYDRLKSLLVSHNE